MEPKNGSSPSRVGEPPPIGKPEAHGGRMERVCRVAFRAGVVRERLQGEAGAPAQNPASGLAGRVPGLVGDHPTLQLLIPAHADHGFRHADHRFRCMPITLE